MEVVPATGGGWVGRHRHHVVAWHWELRSVWEQLHGARAEPCQRGELTRERADRAQLCGMAAGRLCAVLDLAPLTAMVVYEAGCVVFIGDGDDQWSGSDSDGTHWRGANTVGSV